MAAGIGHLVTFNEPNLQKLGQWGKTPMNAATRAMFDTLLAAAAKASGSDRFAVLNTGDADAVIAPLVAGHKAGARRGQGRARRTCRWASAWRCPTTSPKARTAGSRRSAARSMARSSRLRPATISSASRPIIAR
ncbi:MAG: hypothetical protein WDN24_07970 [Sphingomonas sp.]